MQHNWVGYVDTILQYYLHIDPDTLNDEQWANAIAALEELRRQEAKAGKM